MLSKIVLSQMLTKDKMNVLTYFVKMEKLNRKIDELVITGTLILSRRYAQKNPKTLIQVYNNLNFIECILLKNQLIG